MPILISHFFVVQITSLDTWQELYLAADKALSFPQVKKSIKSEFTTGNLLSWKPLLLQDFSAGTTSGVT